jgi:hypothetical protein
MPDFEEGKESMLLCRPSFSIVVAGILNVIVIVFVIVGGSSSITF